MIIVDRYLNAVRFFLPRRLQDDIVRELSENLASDIEARADALGRELTEVEIADMLRRHGHPAIVAGRYGRQQQLIGPVFFPIYVLALKAGLAAAAAITVVLAVVGAASRGGSVPHLVDGLLAFPGRALVVFAWTTIGFALLDVAGARAQLNPDWDPRRLPDWMAGPRRQASISRVESVTSVVFGLLGLGWLLAVPTSPHFALGPLAEVLAFAPVWRTWYVPLVVVAGAQLLIDTHALVRPVEHRRRARIKLALLAAQLVVASFILSARTWVVLQPGATIGGSHSAAEIVHWVNVAFAIGFAVVIVITIVEAGKQFYRLWTVRDAG